MLVDLIISYALMTNEPLYLRSSGAPYADTEVRLEVHYPITEELYLDIKPYVVRSTEDEITGRAGAIVEIGIQFDRFDVELFHHSAHDLDSGDGDPLEVDGIRFRWRMR